MFSFKENECKKIPLTEKSSFADFGAKRPFRTFDAAMKRKVFFILKKVFRKRKIAPYGVKRSAGLFFPIKDKFCKRPCFWFLFCESPFRTSDAVFFKKKMNIEKLSKMTIKKKVYLLMKKDLILKNLNQDFTP